MDKQEKIKELILIAIEEKLINNAVDINIDSISKELHISKRTIYEIFDSKNEIYEIIVKRIYSKIDVFSQSILTKIRSKEISFIDGILELMHFFQKYDNLHNHLYGAFKHMLNEPLMLQKHKNTFFFEIYDIAVENNLIRKDINKEIFFMAVDASMKAIVNLTMKQEYSMLDNNTLKDWHKDLRKILVNGILTEEAKNMFQQICSSEQ